VDDRRVPRGLHGLTNLDIVTVDTLGEALALAAIGLALIRFALLLARLLDPPCAPSRRKE